MEGRILGNYLLGPELGAGGMGTVFLASAVGGTEDLAPGDRVAVKVVHPHLVARPGFVDRFLQEGKIGRRIRHPNVVRTLEVGEDTAGEDRLHYIVMEYVEGRTLRVLLRDLGTVPEALLREIAIQVASGLVAIHEMGIIHRDLKPENFLITDDERVRIMDLGVARIAAESIRLTQEGHFAGSLHYAAPEQFRHGKIGPASDLYSVGVLLHELAAGENPFRQDAAAGIINAHLNLDPPRLNDCVGSISEYFSEVVATLLAKNPADRFASAAKLGQALREGEESTWWGRREQALIQASGHLPRIPVRRETGLYGRDEELAQLRESWKRGLGGEGCSVLLEGEAGIGKTRLVDAFLTGLQGEDVHVLYGSYPPSGGIGGLSDALLTKFGATHLSEAIRPYLGDNSGLVPSFAAMVKHETPPEGHDFLEGEAIHALLCNLLRGLAAEKPVCWVLDDLHFAKPDSRRMVLSMARAVESLSGMLLLTSRPGLPEDETSNLSMLPGFRRIQLGRLSPREVMELLQDAFRSEALAEKLGGKIAYKSDGVPFFVFEMIRGLREGQFLKALPDGTMIETKVVQEIQVPSAVRDLVEGRLKDLTKEERALLDVGTVQGFEFDSDLTARVLERKKVAVLQDLADIERRSGVVRSVGSGYRFDHHQIQEVLYEDLPAELRREYHSMLADAILEREGLEEADPEEVEGETAVILAFHHIRGSRPRAVLPWLLRALGHLADAYRNEATIELADLALAVPGLLEGDLRADVLLSKIRHVGLLGQKEEERAVLDEVFELADASHDLGRRARYRRVLGGHLARISDIAEAEQRLHEAVAIAQVAEDRGEEAKATSSLGNLLRSLGRFDEAEECQQDALRIARDLGDRRDELTALLGLGNVFWSRGDLLEAKRQYEDALALARKIGERRDEAVATGNMGLVLANMGLHEDALAACEASIAILRQIGDRRNEGNFTGNLGLIMAQMGRYAEAVRYHERSQTISREVGDRFGEGVTAINLGPLSAHLGDLDRAREVLEGIVERFEELHAPQPLGYAAQALAEVAETAGDDEEAERLFEDAAVKMRFVSDAVGQASCLQHRAALLSRAGKQDEARRCLESALTLAEESEAHDELVLTLCQLAGMPGGDVTRAEAEVSAREKRLRHSSKLKARWFLFLATGGEAHRDEARRLLRELLDHGPPESRARMAEAVPLHRQILATE